MKVRHHLALAAFGLLTAATTTSCDPSRGQTHEGHGTTSTTGSDLPGDAAKGHEGHAPPAAFPSPEASPAPQEVPPGYTAVTIEPASAKAIGLTTAKVEERDFVRRVRTTGVVVVDETRTARVHTKVRGWIERIHVNFLGQRVTPGEVLCAIYSQEVYAAEIEYLAVLGHVRLESSAHREPGALAPPGADVGFHTTSAEFVEQERRARTELLAAARRRLALWDVPNEEIERLERTREPRRTFPLTAPRGGVVVAKEVLEGTFVDPSTELYTISDLSRVWVLADVYDADVATMRVGQPAQLEIQGVRRPIDAKVSFVPPTIDERTRTLKLRFEIANERRQLRPGAFADVTMDIALGRGLALPENAVIRTGTRAIVFVVHGGTHVMPREVQIGPLVGEFYRVEGGLAPGEDVATGAQFLLDSETRLRASAGAGAGHAGH